MSVLLLVIDELTNILHESKERMIRYQLYDYITVNSNYEKQAPNDTPKYSTLDIYVPN